MGSFKKREIDNACSMAQIYPSVELNSPIVGQHCQMQLQRPISGALSIAKTHSNMVECNSSNSLPDLSERDIFEGMWNAESCLQNLPTVWSADEFVPRPNMNFQQPGFENRTQYDQAMPLQYMQELCTPNMIQSQSVSLPSDVQIDYFDTHNHSQDMGMQISSYTADKNLLRQLVGQKEELSAIHQLPTPPSAHSVQTSTNGYSSGYSSGYSTTSPGKELSPNDPRG